MVELNDYGRRTKIKCTDLQRIFIDSEPTKIEQSGSTRWDNTWHRKNTRLKKRMRRRINAKKWREEQIVSISKKKDTKI